MKTIKNNSNHVITVSNGCFSKDIAINETIVITDEEISNNYMFQFKFFALKEKTENKVEVVRTIGNQTGLWFSSTSYIPMQTEIYVKNYNEIIVETKSKEFVFLTKLFKKICLLIPIMDNCKEKTVYCFPNYKCQKKIKTSLAIESLATVPIFFILMYSCVLSYIESWGWFECIAMSVLTIFSAYSNGRKFYYLLSKFKNKENLKFK